VRADVAVGVGHLHRGGVEDLLADGRELRTRRRHRGELGRRRQQLRARVRAHIRCSTRWRAAECDGGTRLVSLKQCREALNHIALLVVELRRGHANQSASRAYDA
jgi:hypothetical protein